MLLLKLLLGAFYPNYFLQKSFDDDSGRDEFQILGGRDPTNSVYLSGFNQKYIGQLYTTEIRKMFADIATTKDIIISVDEGSEKIFATFKAKNNGICDSDAYIESVPGKVVTEVYKAVKMRKVQSNLELRVLQ